MDVKAIPGEDGEKSCCPRCHGKVGTSHLFTASQPPFNVIKFLVRCLKQKKWLLGSDRSTRTASRALNVTGNWIPSLAAKVGSIPVYNFTQ